MDCVKVWGYEKRYSCRMVEDRGLEFWEEVLGDMFYGGGWV